ncbi:hypothetical protein EHI8A_197730 [Entamoeba histolytica HM-1:IMSS-B]|uniref:Uncharacterized protein n=6 Tax=Entamoeba histolytica TaxID=5759 RepID=C4LUR7_ENTH1|nr:hypothetical protein EHI_178510 [Entamoeba histolytica HM-1:IMSS]EMH72703.1 hypothetical protein EHI8A_197730 [Entamoeba histolytica HM-1:IMSS-B]EMS16808.1 hypothetical protein KM1_272820 [Entamoeba histolytica HM-3:IMSS]ENY60068.1 hypothetical protein EHI7A_171090 [Entamoeba histolytica HM-1:IMSS-A]GAT92372.1 hypothetical protein CL6EHI_178510 [Entamoeba histolytica]EAL47646.1 hypothetical protein EHI_178510 [Entamoeba histolytica HM-1:IMSS]|eukprot:XP_653032.1 hypothetical protein EHI_178510 [Entamoeba histolytica HM-1:IMSS]
MLKICCINGCQEIGKEKLSKIEGKVTVKPEFINTYPRDWMLCERHFIEKAERLDCCIEKCSNSASINELPYDMISKVKIRSNCSHHLICLNHYKRFNNKQKVPNLPPIKREPIEPTTEQIPPEKKKPEIKDDTTTAEDNNETHLKSETVSEKELDLIEKCDITGCNKEKTNIHFMQSIPIKLCSNHFKQFKQALRKAILLKQIQLPIECIALIPKEPNHPLYNYPLLNHDQVCSLCFSNTQCPFKCSTCSMNYCIDCYKMVNQNFDYSDNWICSNCRNKFNRDNIIKQEFELILPLINKSIKKALSEEYAQVIANEQKQIEAKKQRLIERKKKLQSFSVWLVCILPHSLKVHQGMVSFVERKKLNEIVPKENLFIMSKAAREYMTLPHFSSITTAQFIGMAEILMHIIIDNDERLQFKLINNNVPLDIVSLAHSHQYTDILTQIINNQPEWVPTIQLKRLMKKNCQFSYSMLLMKLSLQTTEAVCDGVRVIQQDNQIRNVIIFCGANGGMIGYEGCLTSSGESDNSVGSNFNGIGDFDDEHSKNSSCNDQHLNPLGFPIGIKSTQPSKIIYQTLLINYLAVAIKFAIKGNNNKVGLLIFGKEGCENGTIEIIKTDLENKRVILYGCKDYRDLSQWNSSYEEIKKDLPEILFISVHTEEYTPKDDMSIFKSIASDLRSLTLIKNEQMYHTKIVHLIDSGFIQECNLEAYRNLTSTYISSITE